MNDFGIQNDTGGTPEPLIFNIKKKMFDARDQHLRINTRQSTKANKTNKQTNTQTRQPKQINKTKLARQTRYELYYTNPLRHSSTAPLGRPGGMRGAIKSAAPRRGAGRAG